MAFTEEQCDEIRLDLYDLSQKYKDKNWSPNEWYPAVFLLLTEACYDAAQGDKEIFSTLHELLEVSEKELTK